MSHRPIQIKNLELSFPHKTCFADFSKQINYGERIAIIGRNGSGKSTLLKILAGAVLDIIGDVQIPDEVVYGYVPQVIEDFGDLSGGERLNAAVTQALSCDPNVLLLDEPTNHLDQHNRNSFIRMLKSYVGTLIIVSHDLEILRTCVNTLWHIDKGKVQVFSGEYDNYISTMHKRKGAIEQELVKLKRQKKALHEELMQQQVRVAKSKASGEKKVKNKKWLKMVGDVKKMKAEKSQGKTLKDIEQKKQELSAQLAEISLPEIIVPKFSLTALDVGKRTIIAISNGTIGYKKDLLLHRIGMSTYICEIK